ncbi:topoisomerase II [Erwinia sp. CPCC 100877]|nr:topoisomerase II [Erwinia sp. CPCC 100877]
MMNWMVPVFIAWLVLVVALAALFWRRQRRGAAAAVIGAGIVIALLLIAVRSGKTNTASQMALEEIPVWQVIREQEPAIYSELNKRVQEMEQVGQSQQQIIDLLQTQITALAMQRLQEAPDDSVVAWMRASIEQAAQIQKASGDACFRYLFPAAKGGIDAAKYLTPTQMQRRFDVDAQMMRAARGAGRHRVSSQERKQARAALELVLEHMQQLYGQDVLLMAAPQQAQGKESRVCDMVLAFWRQVLALPPEKAAAIVRQSVTMGATSSH